MSRRMTDNKHDRTVFGTDRLQGIRARRDYGVNPDTLGEYE